MLVTGWVAARWRAATPRDRLLLVPLLLCCPVIPALVTAPEAVQVASLLGTWDAPLEGTSGIAVALCALAGGVLWRPFPRVPVLAAGGSAVAIGLSSLTRHHQGGDALLPILLPLLLLAAFGCRRCFELVRSGLPAAEPMTPLAASSVWLALSTVLLVDTLLFATVFEGGRPPWRDAAYAALSRKVSSPSLLVSAAGGYRSLTFYLRPNHWRDVHHDPHPGVRVEDLDLHDPVPALKALAARARSNDVLVVLRGDEVRLLTANPAAKEVLDKSFKTMRIVARPLHAGEAGITLFRAVEPG
jgi:hypothetical protein